MPAGDGTGPMGEGPLTGRGLGPCDDGRRFGRRRGFGWGQGFGRGRGWGFGRGFGRGRGFGPGRGRGFGWGGPAVWDEPVWTPMAPAAAPQVSREDEKAELLREKEFIEKRLKELE